MINFFTIVLVCFFFITKVNFVFSQSVYFEEIKGLVVAEIESVTPTVHWTEKTDRDGYCGISFYEWTSDNRFNSPGVGILEYTIKINTPGIYRFQWHSKVGHGNSSTEANDSWLRIPNAADFFGYRESDNDTVRPHGLCIDDCPDGSGNNGWFKVYSSGTSSWTWVSSTSDNDAHDIYAKFDTTGFYTVQVSGRSKYHLLDRFVLYNDSVTQEQAIDKSNIETKIINEANPTSKLQLIFKDFNTGLAIQNLTANLDGVKRKTDKNGVLFYYNLKSDTIYEALFNSDFYGDTIVELNIKSDTVLTYLFKEKSTEVELVNKVKASVLPNPTDDKFVINANKKINVLQIFNSYGNCVFSVNNINELFFEHNLMFFPNGLYILQLQYYSSNKVDVFKIIKK